MVFECQYCNKQIVWDENSRSKGFRKNACNACRGLRFRQRLKFRSIDYKGGRCSNCGYNKSVYSLSFHHIDDSTKEFKISIGQSWTKTKTELDKCILLCNNCHGEFHEQKDGKIFKDINFMVFKREVVKRAVCETVD